MAECRIQTIVDSLYPCDQPVHKGAGMYVRTMRGYPKYADKHLHWLSACVLAGGRERTRNDGWWNARRNAGLTLSAWDWFPNPEDPHKNLRAAIEYAADKGCVSFILNAEKDFFNKPQAAEDYAGYAREVCDTEGLKLGLSSYASTNNFKHFPWASFQKYCHFGSPQIYDRESKFIASYPPRAIGSWKAEGFDKLVAGCGIFTGRKTKDGWKFRARTAKEVERHLKLFPEVDAILAWPLAGQPPEATIKALSDHFAK